MAIVQKTLEQIRVGKPRFNRAKFHATSEEDIRRHRIEDGEGFEESLEDFAWTIPAASVRKRLDLTQEQVAALLRMPVATWRNWEQNRVRPDPAGRALLTLLYRQPEIAKEALGLERKSRVT